ncbi:LapA family protein [Evansella tamaricis]|uniref:DUF1049 domain-containing protein n=1 Tax=Evansella tamaricis TaxID=2069301 RepID=A0ABS6JFS6_9BACI|nr:lipopolysaccharide assembly LapA domain-containing protein [Evansella tamaricis]MBU9712514.1 DUF1049 domain-containing protein [Evansella tamaricis]
MKGQWGLIFGIVMVLIIAVFSVINVDPVEVNFLFGQAQWPLVIVIIFSVLMGGIIVGSVGMYKIYQLQREIKKLRRPKPTEIQPENESNLKNKKDSPTKERESK